LSIDIQEHSAVASGAQDEQNNRSLRLLIRLLRCTQAVKNRFRVRLDEEFGTTLAKWDMVATLARRTDGMTMSKLSEALMVSNGNVTQLVNRLINDKLVTKKVDAEDRRFAKVRLTRKGRQLFDSVAAANLCWADRMFEQVSEAEIDDLIQLLGTLRKSIESSRW